MADGISNPWGLRHAIHRRTEVLHTTFFVTASSCNNIQSIPSRLKLHG